MISPELLDVILKAGMFTASLIRDALLHHDPVNAVAQLGTVLPPAHQMQLEDAALVAAQRRKAGL